jgi:hypothetical protein
MMPAPAVPLDLDIGQLNQRRVQGKGEWMVVVVHDSRADTITHARMAVPAMDGDR